MEYKGTDWGSDFNQIDKKNIPPVQVPIKKGAIPLCLVFVEFICVFSSEILIYLFLLLSFNVCSCESNLFLGL